MRIRAKLFDDLTLYAGVECEVTLINLDWMSWDNVTRERVDTFEPRYEQLGMMHDRLRSVFLEDVGEGDVAGYFDKYKGCTILLQLAHDGGLLHRRNQFRSDGTIDNYRVMRALAYDHNGFYSNNPMNQTQRFL
ncbi:MAG: hypothetical protein OK454_03080 [Thaumarchaeota archaeon]|nr:hypothetical protein [Nitrososphaerota archaeon]